MNKHRHRIIFNLARGMMMVVAEFVKSHTGKPKTDAIPPHSCTPEPPQPQSTTTLVIRPIAFSLLIALGQLSFILPHPGNLSEANAEIFADPNAPRSQQPIILRAPNGVEVVNIRTPNAKGLSINAYQQFDVPTHGVIMNNSSGNVKTQLGGWINGNSYLISPAKIIFNQVNSSHPSYLNGFIEIAGGRAEFVLVNPNGISCNGCGFINAYRATLTTGTPIFNGGDLAGYRVHGGDISIIGDGLDASNTNYIDIIARAVEVNAGIWAKDLKITTGTNQVNASNTQATALTPAGAVPASGFALDVGALGGMYAGKITMLGTEAGLGVRNAGVINAATGNIALTADGQLVNTGSLIAHGNQTIATSGSISNQGTIYAQGNASLDTQGNIDNTSIIAAQGNVDLIAHGVNSNITSTANSALAAGLKADGTLIPVTNGTGNLNISATQAASALGQNLSAGDQTITAKQLDVSGSATFANNLSLLATVGDLHAQNATVSANHTLSATTTQTLNADNAVIMADQLNLTAHDLRNVGGKLIQTGTGDTSIVLAGNLDNSQGRIATNSQNLTLAAQTLTNASGSIEHAGAGQLVMTATTLNGDAGQIISNGSLDLKANSANLNAASTIAKQISMDTDVLNNQQGEIIQTGSGDASIKATTTLDNTAGVIASNGNTTLTVGNLHNQGATIQVTGTANLTINASGHINNSMLIAVAASLQVGGALNVNADSIDNTQSEMTAGDTLTIHTASTTAALQNTQGLIAANQALTLNAASINNSNGTIASVYDSANITGRVGSIHNSAGQIKAGTALTTNSLGFNNADGTIAAESAGVDTQTQLFDNTRGSMVTNAALDLQTGALINDTGLIQSGAGLIVNTHNQTFTNSNSGSDKGILSLGSATFTTADLNNSTGYIGAQGTITVNSVAVNNQTGTLTSEATINLDADSLNNQAGRVEALGDVVINTINNMDNQAGLLRSGQTLSLKSATLDNQYTQNANQGIQAANVEIHADHIHNTSGSMLADNNLLITGSNTLNNTQGEIASGVRLHIQDKLAQADSNVIGKTLDIINTGGMMIAGSVAESIAGGGSANADLNIDSQSLSGDGKVLSQGDLTTKLTTDYTHSGEWQANGNASFTTTGKITNRAKLLAAGNLNMAAANLDNQTNAEIAAGNLNVTVNNTLTNRGLIDGSDTFINTATLNNIGTGSIYGDHIAIAASTLNNREETVNSVTSAAVIAARDRLDIGATNITNREHALLFSAGDMAIGGALDQNHQATVGAGEPQANVLNNNSATIEALGDLTLNIASINNTNEHFTTSYGIVSESTTPARSADVRGISYSPAPAPGNTRRYQLSYFSTDGALVFGGIYNYDQVSFYTPGFVHIVLNPGVPDAAYTDPLTGSKRDFVTFMQYNNGTIVKETSVATTDPGQILAGGSMQINATDVLNDNSKIVAGGALSGNISNLNNHETLGTRSSWSTSQSAFFRSRESCNCSRYFQYLGDSAPVIETINLGTSTYLGNASFTGTNTQVAALNTNSVSQTATGASNANVAVVTTPNPGGNTHLAPVITNTQTGTNTIVRTVNPNTTLPNNSLFHTNPNSTASYLIETDPRFANYRNWLSSDYMLTALSYDPATVTKRLGDGFYEQRLIREQINQLTGRRFLSGYANDETEYQALMTNGITFAKAYQLIPGVTLSDAQIAQLTSDIVWLVEKTITLADGTTVQALVPQVYVKLQAGDIDGAGSLIAGDSINLNLSGDPATGAGGTLVNSGSIAGRSIVAINANNIHNLQGRISGNNTLLNAQHDINNLGGSIQGNDLLSLNAGHDINIASTTQSNRMQYDVQNGKLTHVDVSRTNIDRVAGLYVTNPNGVLVASAGHDINLQGAVISNSGDNGITVLDANNDIQLGTIATSSNNSYVRDARNYQKNNSTEQVGSSIQTKGDVMLNADHNISARAANVNSEAGALTVNAGNDVTVAAGTNTKHAESASYSKKKGSFSSKTKTTRDTFNDTDVISSTFSGETVNFNAGNDLTITASNVVGTGNVNLNVGNNVTLNTAQATHDETHYSKTKKSGFSASTTSIGYGTSKLQTTNDTQTVTNVGSTVGSVEGNVNINSGKTYTQTGSDILTPQGDINISAQKVDINAATDTYANQQTMKYKQSGITVGISNPVISAAQTVSDMHQAASQTQDGRMQALAAGTAALAVSNAYNAVNSVDQFGNIASAGNTGANDLTHVTEANAADQVGGININISIGTSKSKSSSSQTVNTAKGSTLNAGGDINITASGAGKDSDINVTGSQIKAAHDVTLQAEDEINLNAAQNTSQLQSKNKSSSASLGVSVSLGANAGVGITAGISSGKGKANGNGTSWTETQIQGGNTAGDTVTLQSGTDTTLKGAQVTGNQVIANVGTSGTGNLNIQSLQDTDQYKAKQSSNGISVTVPVVGTGYGGSISTSKTKINSDYASVNEQSGIFAGDGGFQVNVNGNTDLKGAVIASSDKAIKDKANSLTTETLTTGNIENKAEYEGKSSSATIGGGLQGGLPQLSGAGIGKDSGDAESVTASAISSGTVKVTDNNKQIDVSGNDAVTTVALLNRDVHVNEKGEAVDSQGNSTANTITPIFDKEKVQREIAAQTRITQAFSQEAPRALNTFVQEKIKPYLDAKKVARETEALLAKANQSDDSQSAYKAELQDKINQAYETMAETQDDYDKWKENGEYRIASNIIIAAISGGESAIGSSITKESLSWAADVMRQNMIKDSEQFAGICVASTNDCISNKSGSSVGVNSDGIKVAGGRIVLADWCDKGRCEIDSSTKSGYKENADGTVIFNPGVDEYGKSLTIYQFIETYADKYELRSPLGGAQGGEGQMKILGIQFDYAAGSFWDKLAEAYSGTHDTLNSFIWYDEMGNGKALDGTLIGKIGSVGNITNVAVATPFALSVLLPPEVWGAVFSSLKSQ